VETPLGKYPHLVEPLTREEIEADMFEADVLEVSGMMTSSGNIGSDDGWEVFDFTDEDALFDAGIVGNQHTKDHGAALSLLLREVGISLEMARSLYSPGWKDVKELDLRRQVDSILLKFSQEPGLVNMAEISRSLGMYIDPSSHNCKSLKRALKRARKVADETQ